MSEYEAKGDKANQGKWFKLFSDTDAAQENYTLAANIFKRDQKWKDAARCFLKAASILESNQETLFACKDYAEAGQCLMKINDPGYENCFLSAIGLYDKCGHFGQSGRLYKIMAETLVSQGRYNNAIEYYKKAADSFSLDEYSKSNYSQAIMSYAELIAQYHESYFDAMKIFEEEARKALDNNLLRYGAKTLLFKAGLLSLASGDVDNGHVALEKYLRMDNRFQHSREAQLLNGILDSLNNQDYEAFVKCLESYEQVALVSAWERHFIDKIKMYVSSYASGSTTFNRKGAFGSSDGFSNGESDNEGEVDLM